MHIFSTPGRKLGLLALVAVMSFAAAGCLVTSDSSVKQSGNYVADSTFDQIQPGRTTVGWVQATLGKPTSISTLEDGTEIWKYTYTVRKESSGAVFLIFGGHNANEVDHTAFVQINHGVVTKAWRT